MIQIRRGTFETNSSSAHSFVVMKGEDSHYTSEEAKEELWLHDGIFWPYGDMYFGRSPFRVLSTFREKLKYAYACAPIRRGRVRKNGNNGYWTEYYKVTNVVKKFIPEYKGIDRCKLKYCGTDDHMLFGWLEKANMSLIEFLTNKNVVVICDGDEYRIWTDMKKLGIINTNNIKMMLPEKEWWENDYQEESDD